MTSPELDRLVETGSLKREPPIRDEYDGLLRNAAVRLEDASNEHLHAESRFDLAYSAAHSLAVAALRRLGYRPGNRRIVFQALAHSLGTPAASWRFLSRCHDQRNLREYEGFALVDERMLMDLVRIAHEIQTVIRELPPPD
jgi:hypothetical protein